MRKTQYVEVEVDLDDFDEAELVDYVKDLGYRVYAGNESHTKEERLDNIYEALKLDKTERALELMREYVCDELGRIL